MGGWVGEVLRSGARDPARVGGVGGEDNRASDRTGCAGQVGEPLGLGQVCEMDVLAAAALASGGLLRRWDKFED